MFQHMRSLTRRSFLECIAAATATPALGLVPSWVYPLQPYLVEGTFRSLDADLPEITIGKLQAMYAERKYTVRQVTEWYLARIARFDSVYRAMIHVDRDGAIRRASELDRGRGATRGPL